MKQALRQLLSDFLSAILFLVVYAVSGSPFAAGGIAVAAGLGQLIRLKLTHRQIEPMQWMSLGLVVVLGSATMLTAECRPREGGASSFDSPREGAGFEPSVPLYGQLGTSGACDATHAAIVKLETSDRSRRRARRAICGTPGAPSARFPRDSGALDAKFDRRLASDTRMVFPPHVIWITLFSQPGTYIQGQ